MKEKQYTKTVTLTPYLAKRLLDSNYENQRRLNRGKAESMARDIEGGRWNNNIAWADPFGCNHCREVYIRRYALQRARGIF